MIPSIPKPEDYDVSPENGFLSAEPPLQSLPNEYYQPWEYVVKNLQGLILSKRLRQVVDRMPILSTDKLEDEAQWRRAYSTLAFIAHAYIWSGDRPHEWVPPTVTLPFMKTCRHLQLPPVATYAGLVLWNWKPIFSDEPVDTLANLDMIDTFTGSLDEKWFYLISVAIEARGAP
ncbi:indoleamine 2,3-dioxygenase subfamily, partial [Hortaea werneckii]